MVHVNIVLRSTDGLEQSSLQSHEIAVPQLPQPEPEVDAIACHPTPSDVALVHNTQDTAGTEYPEALADHHRGLGDVIEGGNANCAVEGVVSKRKIFGHPKQKRKPVLVCIPQAQRIDSYVALPICQKALIGAGTATKIENPPLWPDEGKEALLKPGTLALLFREIPTVESIEQYQLLPP